MTMDSTSPGSTSPTTSPRSPLSPLLRPTAMLSPHHNDLARADATTSPPHGHSDVQPSEGIRPADAQSRKGHALALSESFLPKRPASAAPGLFNSGRNGPALRNGQNSRPGPAALANGSTSRKASGTGSSLQSRRIAHSGDPNLLLKLQTGVVKGRSGSVLTRGFILKNDRLPSRLTRTLEFRLKGVPNFRSGGEGIYGAAQPSITGLRTVLSVLGCHPQGLGKAVWICTREEPVIYIGGSPFVLRDAEEPFRAFTLSDRPEALESTERRLKQDILREALKYGGVVQVQEEIEEEGHAARTLSTWIAASEDNVMTLRELWESLVQEGYAVDYRRIAISSDENPENKYLDAFLDVLRNLDIKTSLFFNCGAGVTRTTFAMTMALLVRRHQATIAESPDASISATRQPLQPLSDQNVRRHLLAEADAAADRNKSLLRLMAIINGCIPLVKQHSILNVLLSHPEVLENLRKAASGEYDIILALLSCLEDGKQSKALADAAITRCASVTNLRESVLDHRIHLALAATDTEDRDMRLSKAVIGLERYFFLIAFASYVTSTNLAADLPYSRWLVGRAELRNMVERLRKPAHSAWVFKPVADLSLLSQRGRHVSLSSASGPKRNDSHIDESEAIGDEFATQLVRSRRGITLRAGTILKKDIWRDAAEANHPTKAIRGALNFRQISQTDIYALSQPTDLGIVSVLSQIQKQERDTQHRITWVNLREEPLCYINGAPYVLREESLSLRNLKSYAGISASRLELIEDRLKQDVLAEIQAGDGRLLLHSERADGTITSVWETVEPHNVATLREVMKSVMRKNDFDFRRLPITAEGPPNFQDVADLIDAVSLSPIGHSVIVNCQLGRGRSTMVSVMLLLFRNWLIAGGKQRVFSEAPAEPTKVLAYAVINNLIRVIRNGREIKMHVDAAIQECSEVYNLIDAVDDARQRVSDAPDHKKDAALSRGLNDLRRYFTLILFAAWLNESSGDHIAAMREQYSFERFIRSHPVFTTIYNEIDVGKSETLNPLGTSRLSDGVAEDEAGAVVASRSGRILSASTILKSDLFLNLQKMSLPDRVDGAPNYRRAPMYLESELDASAGDPNASHAIYGTGMPTVGGLRTALEKMGAGTSGKTWVYWTLMREEPVIFIRGRPHVLRLLASPLENVVTTGVTAESVEGQERALKGDVINEANRNGGRVLLHDESDDGNGKFVITAQWEEGLTEEDVLTPAEAYNKMIAEGYKLNYARLPVTDEQAPIPRVFARLEERVAAALQHEAVAMAFNCQMGRGRTTSAMVAASLVASILHPPEVFETGGGATVSDIGTDDTFAIRDIEDPFQHGEYKIIFQLVSVLQHGKQAKYLADTAIDQCEAVQNLRKAVATYRLQWESAEKGSSKREKIFGLAFNYLYRYGTLIAFANYLLEKSEMQSGKMSSSFTLVSEADATISFPSFPEYLTRRPEINHILSRKTLD